MSCLRFMTPTCRFTLAELPREMATKSIRTYLAIFSFSTMRRYTSLLLFHLIACETAVEVDVPRNPPQLTVNGLFNPDSVWQVELTQNRYILDSEPFTSVPDAEVRVWQDGQTVAVLDYVRDVPYTGNSIYRAQGPRPQRGVNYTLEVSHPELGNLTASSQVPTNQTTTLRVVLNTLDFRPEPDISPNTVAYSITLPLEDPPGENYYSLSFLVRFDVFGTTTIDGSDEDFLALREIWSPVALQSDDPIVDDAFNSYRNELLFKDKSFDGQPYELKVYGLFNLDNDVYNRVLDRAFEFVLQEDAYNFEGKLVRQVGDTVGFHTLYALLRTTTKEYYNYHYTRDLQASVENNPFAQPVQVFDNIEGGLGIFAGYQQVEKEVTIK